MQGAYPLLFKRDDPQYAMPDTLSWALGVAYHYRPACLPPHLQNEAQGHYAAHLIQKRAADMNRDATGGAPTGRVVEVKQGDVSVKYADASAATGADSPAETAYEAYRTLAKLCGYGAIITGADDC